MTNFEKVKELLTIEDMVTDTCKAIYRLRNEKNCSYRTCEECRKWLEEDYKELIVLSETERIILENLDKNFKYIARDKSGKLYVFKKIPTKSFSIWHNSIYGDLSLFRHLFQFIKWKDTEPYSIEKLLKGSVFYESI